MTLTQELAQALRECLELADNWPGVAYTVELDQRARAALAKYDAEPPTSSRGSEGEVTEAMVDAAERAMMAVFGEAKKESLVPDVRREMTRAGIKAALRVAAQSESPCAS